MKKSMVFEAVAVLLLILLLFAMYAMVTSGAPAAIDKWNATIGPSTYLYAGDNGVLYAFDSNNIRSIGEDGSVRWSLYVPYNRTMTDTDYDFGLSGELRPRTEPALALDNGVLYVYVKPKLDSGANPVDLQDNITPVSSIMAVSPDGTVRWDTIILSGANGPPAEIVNVSVCGDRLYVYYGDLAVLDTSGTLLFTIDGIMAQPAVDEQGDIYAVKYDGNGSYDTVFGYLDTFDTIVAYHPDGSQWWQKKMKEPLQDRYMDLSMNLAYSSLPIYHDGRLYVPMKKSLVALNTNGTGVWSRDFQWRIHPFLSMLFNPQGNICLIESTMPTPGSDGIEYKGIAVSPDGVCSDYTIMWYRNSPTKISNGIGYYTGLNNWLASPAGGVGNPSGLTDLVSTRITAVDLTTGQALWNFTVPIDNIKEITLGPSNIDYLDEIRDDQKYYHMYYSPTNLNYPASADESIAYNKIHPELQDLSKDAIGPWKVAGAGTMKVLPGNDVVYVSYYMFNYEYPVSLTRPPYDDGSDAYNYPDAAIFNRSKLAYAGGILAIDNNGHLLWNRPTDSMVTTMAANNSTVFYGTGDGKLSATQVNAAVGFALAATAYLFLRFFCVGAVARAKARINKNENRNLVLDFIVKNPGSSLYEVTRGTGVNLGTVRYHLFILSLNHKVVASQTDRKYVRYFTNSGTYSKEEQLVLSLMRRDSMGRVLGLMVEKPGLSNVEIARELDIKESVVSRYVKELSDKGVVARDTGRGYFVGEEHREYVARAARRIYGQ